METTHCKGWNTSFVNNSLRASPIYYLYSPMQSFLLVETPVALVFRSLLCKVPRWAEFHQRVQIRIMATLAGFAPFARRPPISPGLGKKMPCGVLAKTQKSAS
jgi:hypothetical protein